MRGLWAVASLATASSSNNVSSVLSSLDMEQPSVQNEVSSNPIASAIASAVGSSGSTSNNSKNPINVGQLIQSAMGDGTNPGVVSYLNKLGVSSSNAAGQGASQSSSLDLGIEKSPMNAAQTLELAQSVLTDSSSLMNQSSLVNLFPALTGGLLTNVSAGNLLGLLNNGNTNQILSTITGVITDPQILNSAASLTNSPAIQGASALSNIGASVASVSDIGNALANKRSLQQSANYQPMGILSARSAETHDFFKARRLDDTAKSLDISALTNSLLGNTAAGGLNLGTLANSLLGGTTGLLGNTGTGGLNLASLAGNLLGGAKGTTGTTGTGLDLSSLTNSLSSLTGGLGTGDSFQGLANSTIPLTSIANTKGTSSSNTLEGVAATFITNNYLNPSGQIALKSTPFAQKALQYPDLVAVLNGQSPISSADGQLTQAVQIALKQMDITANTPAALISTISSTDSRDQSTNLLVNPLSNLAANTAANATAILEESQKALQDSLASLTNASGASTSVQDLLNSLSSNTSTNNLLNGLLPGTVSQTRVLGAAASTEEVSVESTTPGEIEGLREALLHFNEALKKAIKANEERTAADAEDVKAVGGDEKHRMLENWFSAAWEKIKTTFSSAAESTDDEFLSSSWKDDVNQAAGELADNLNTMADKIRGTDVSSLIESWFDKAKEDLASKATEMLPRITIGSVAESPSRAFDSIASNVSQEAAILRRLVDGRENALAVNNDVYKLQSLTGEKDQALSAGVEDYNFQSAGKDHALSSGVEGYNFQSAGKDHALSSGVEGYNFQSAGDGIRDHALSAGVEGYNFQSAGSKESALSAGFDEYNFQGALGGGVLGTDLLGSSLYPQTGLLTGIQPVINSLSQPFLGAIGTLGTVNPLLQTSPLQQLLNTGASGLRLFQEGNNSTDVNGTAGQDSNTAVSADIQSIQQLQNIALMLKQLELQSLGHLQSAQQMSSSGQSDSSVDAPSGMGAQAIVSKDQADEGAQAAAATVAEKSLNSIDVKEWINKLSNTELGKTFGLDQLDTSKLPTLPDIEDAELEKFVEESDWENVFNALRLSDLPGLQNENESTLKQMVKDGKIGEILSRVDLSNLPGLENVKVEDILKQFNKAHESQESSEAVSEIPATQKASEEKSKERLRRRLQNNAAGIVSNGASTLTDSLTGGATSTLLSGQQSLLNQLQGITNLADGLTGLTSGLNYGLTNLNTNVMTGSNLLTNGIGNLLGNVNSGLGTNLNNLESGLSGLTSSIGTNLNSGLGSTGTGLGSGQLNLLDLSGLGNLIPSTTASTLSNTLNSAVQPTLSYHNLTSATGYDMASSDATSDNNVKADYPVSVSSVGDSTAKSALSSGSVSESESSGSTVTGNTPNTSNTSVDSAASTNSGSTPDSTTGLTLSDSDLNKLMNLLTQVASNNSASTTGTSGTPTTGTALQILHAFVGMRRMLNSENTNGSTSANSAMDLVNSLTAQLTGGTAATSGQSLMDSLTSSLNLNNLPSASNTSLDTLLSSLNSTLGNPTATANAAANGTTASNNSQPQFQSASSASTGVAIPDLQSILGGSYKRLQSVGSSTDGGVTSILGNSLSGLPDLTSLTGATSSLPDLNSLLQSLGQSTATNGLTSSTANIPSLTSSASTQQLPSASDLLSSVGLNGLGTNLSDTLNQSLASLTGGSTTNDLTSSLNQSLNSLASASNVALPSALPAALPDLSSLLQQGAAASGLNDLTSNLLAQLNPTSAPASNGGSIEKAGDHVVSALNDISTRRLKEINLGDYVKEIEREEVLAEGMLSAEYRKKIDQIKHQAGTSVADAQKAQLQISLLEAEYQGKMKAVGQLAHAQRIYAAGFAKNLPNTNQGGVALGQVDGQKTVQSKSGVVVAPLMGNGQANANVVGRRLLLSDRVINLQPNSALASSAYVSSTPPPEFHPEHPRPEEWIEEYMPPVLKSMLNMLSSVEPAPPAYRTAAMKQEPVRNLQGDSFRNEQLNNANVVGNAVAAGDVIPSVGSALSFPGYIPNWQLNGGQRISGFDPFRGGSSPLDSVSGTLGFNVGQFPGSSSIASADQQLNIPLYPTGQNNMALPYNPYNNQFLSVNNDGKNLPGVANSKNINSEVVDSNLANSKDSEFNSLSGEGYAPILGEQFDPVGILTEISNSNLDVPGLFKILAKSNVDWNDVVAKLRNGSTFETLVPEMINDGLDVPAILTLVNESDLNVNNLLSNEKRSGESLGANSSRNSTLEDLLAQLDGLDLNALIKSTAVAGIDLKSVILMLNKDGVDLQNVADSPVMPIMGHVAAMSQLEDVFDPHEGMINPHELLQAMETVENELEPL